jgi:hypothetical protein
MKVMTAHESIETKMIAFSDRVGRATKDAGEWFANMIEESRLRDGRRSGILELHELGEQLVQWIGARQTLVAARMCDELEAILSGGDFSTPDAATFTIELLEGVASGISEWKELHDGPSEIESGLLKVMGDDTKLLWIPMISQ